MISSSSSGGNNAVGNWIAEAVLDGSCTSIVMDAVGGGPMCFANCSLVFLFLCFFWLLPEPTFGFDAMLDVIFGAGVL